MTHAAPVRDPDFDAVETAHGGQFKRVAGLVVAKAGVAERMVAHHRSAAEQIAAAEYALSAARRDLARLEGRADAAPALSADSIASAPVPQPAPAADIAA